MSEITEDLSLAAYRAQRLLSIQNEPMRPRVSLQAGNCFQCMFGKPFIFISP